jgi:hypothetical protein
MATVSRAGFIAGDVDVNGHVQGLSDYVAGLESVVSAIPDYHWELLRLCVSEGRGRTSATRDPLGHLPRRGGNRPARRARRNSRSTPVAAGLIAEFWVVADNLYLLEQLR